MQPEDQSGRFCSGSATVSEVGCGSAPLACVSSLSLFLLSADPERLVLNGHRLKLGAADDKKEPGNPAEDSRLFAFRVC